MIAEEGFDWLVTLKELSSGKRVPSYIEIDKLARLAQGWPTCACGQLCKTLERMPDGSPDDYTLRQFGTEFFHYVRKQKWCLALETFKQIEDRTTNLLAEQLLSSTTIGVSK